MPIPRQSGQQILDLLRQGYVRYKRDDDGNGLGSIEEVTGLRPCSLKEVFKHPRLVNIPVKVPLYILVDDFEPEDENQEVDNDEAEEVVIPANYIVVEHNLPSHGEVVIHNVPDTAPVTTAVAEETPVPVEITAPAEAVSNNELETMLTTLIENEQEAEDSIFA